MRLSRYWDIEDIFFGALFGSFFGSYLNTQDFIYVGLLVGFFVIFPSVVRKASKISDQHVQIALISSMVWFFVFILAYSTNEKNTINYVPFIIYLGWSISVVLRVFKK